jgi:hypothetical protein
MQASSHAEFRTLSPPSAKRPAPIAAATQSVPASMVAPA